MAAADQSPVLRATARLQLHRDFGFAQAGAVLDYYAKLGVSHLYVSPIMTARPGSTHGYDVVDPTRVNPELGGEAGLRQLCGELHRRGMGLVVDIVPNHMAVGAHNPWWQDVLRWGRHSRHAQWFDIDWDSPDAALNGKLLLPFLGQTYGQALAAGELNLRFDAQRGELLVAHHDNYFPLSPHDYATVLQTAGSARLAAALDWFAGLGQAPEPLQHAAHGTAMLRALAEQREGMADIDAALAAFSAAQPQGADSLHQLLERQHYRLAFWRNAADEINWRRFFEVSELVGMRAERDDVFEAMHATLFRLYGDGLIDGVRLDHIDGLAEPAAYCQRLRQRLRALRPGVEPYIIAEKILAHDEHLPATWALDGSTGYEFMDQCAGVLHDAQGEAVLDATWRDIAPQLGDYDGVVREARRALLGRNLAAEFNALALCLHQLARAAVATRDLPWMAIRRSLTELLVHFPVYRTYATANDTAISMPAADRETLACAAIAASATLHPADLPVLHIIEGWLGGDALHAGTETVRHALQWRAITRFQQLTPPLTAKSVEDTAFYRYGRLLSRNEVGSEPSRLAWALAQFHQQAAWRAEHAPASLLATATHDHKRGEDARMRLAVLSELAAEWQTLVQRWRQLNAPIVQATAGEQGGIEAADECMLYQTLLGAWPDDLRADADGLQPLRQLAQRVVAWQRKALREAKRRSDWLVPQEAYEQACERFLSALLDDPGLDARRHPFLLELEHFVHRLAPAAALNSLSQTMLKLATPGVPDLYQGSELVDLSLVDPDNRRPVDFNHRMRLLDDGAQRPVSLRQWQSGVPKQQLIHAVLGYRRVHPALFAQGQYLPLSVYGQRAHHVIAFARVLAQQVVIVICTRLSAALLPGGEEDALPLVPREAWGDTWIALPSWLAQASSVQVHWRSVLTSGEGVLHSADDGEASVLGVWLAEVLGSLPVEMLELHLPSAGGTAG